MAYNPFEEVEPLAPLNPLEVYHRRLVRSSMWDMVGPRMVNEPEKFNQTPASKDVLDDEYRDLILRKHSLIPLGLQLEIACRTAAESATIAVLAIDPAMADFTDEQKLSFLAENVRVSESVTKSVIGHLISTGVLVYGAVQ